MKYFITFTRILLIVQNKKTKQHKVTILTVRFKTFAKARPDSEISASNFHKPLTRMSPKYHPIFTSCSK